MFGRPVQTFAGILMVVAGLGGSAIATSAEPMLTVRNVSDGESREVRLSEEDLLRLPQVTIRTTTEWTEGVAEFTGPLARDVLEQAGIGLATTAHMIAVNDYTVDIPIRDLLEYDVVLAMSVNGERLHRRDKGPLWVVYPISDHKELVEPVINTRMIWQLTAIEMR